MSEQDGSVGVQDVRVVDTPTVRYRQGTRWWLHALVAVVTGGLSLPISALVVAWNFGRSGKKTWRPVW